MSLKAHGILKRPRNKTDITGVYIVYTHTHTNTQLTKAKFLKRLLVSPTDLISCLKYTN